MSISHLLVALALSGLLIFRLALDDRGRADTRLLGVALVVGIVRFGMQTMLFLFDSDLLISSMLILTDALYVLFFLLIALHFTARNLPPLGYWLPQSLIYLVILFAGALILFDEGFNTTGLNELIRTLLFLSATLAFVTISRSGEMLDRQPVFWIPTMIVATGFGVATAAKFASTVLHFSASSAADLLLSISSSLGVVATLLLLIFLAANISWLRGIN
jgi:hypothetical protein